MPLTYLRCFTRFPAQNLLFMFLINLPFDIYASPRLLVIWWKTVNPRSGRWCVLNDKHRKVIVSDGCNPVTTEGVIELEIEMDDFEQEVQHGMQIHHWTIDNLFWSVAKATLSKCCFGKTMPPPFTSKGHLVPRQQALKTRITRSGTCNIRSRWHNNHK